MKRENSEKVETTVDEFEEELDFSNEFGYDDEDGSKESLEDLIDELTAE